MRRILKRVTVVCKAACSSFRNGKEIEKPSGREDRNVRIAT
jgi:hypothetical protein